MVKVGKPVLIRFTDEQLTALDSLAAQSGQSIAALVRWCVDRSLPTLIENIRRNAAANESTIDANPKP